jgi:hypothetical protein
MIITISEFFLHNMHFHDSLLIVFHSRLSLSSIREALMGLHVCNASRLQCFNAIVYMSNRLHEFSSLV